MRSHDFNLTTSVLLFRRELAATRDELTAVREEYVRVCGEREEGEGERERAIAAAVQEVKLPSSPL